MSDKKPSKEFSSRYSAAKRYRESARPFLEEILSFVCPGREKDFAKTVNKISDDDPETFISLPEDLAADFASDLVSYYTPSETVWTEYLVTAPVEEDQVDIVIQLVNQREEDIFELIQASNYNDVAPQIMFEANHGTVAFWAESSHLSQPMHVETVPPNELLITPGHLGILDRFREKFVLASTLPALFAEWEVDLSDPALKKKIEKAGQKSKICWGFWVDWADPGNPLWRAEITAEGKRITPKEPLTLGPLAGACPLLVGRFNPQVGKPWGRGPGWKALPDLRVLNAVDEAVLDGLDQSLRSTLIYADDGFLDMSEGIEAGRAYPASRGFTRDQVYEMNKQVNLDTGFFSEERLEDRLRARFFQDGPRQRGDTPPTLGQWVDERRRVQQRLGKPSAPLWSELFLPFIQRVEYIGIEKGIIDGPLTNDGDVIKVLPISPLQKAANQDKIQIARSNMELAVGTFGESVGEVLDFHTTFKNIVDASGDDLTKLLDPQEQQEQNEQPPAPPV